MDRDKPNKSSETFNSQKQRFQEWILEQLAVLSTAKDKLLSPERQQIYVRDLSDVPASALAIAFERARKELDYFPQISELRRLCGQINDGRPGPEESWARMPKGDRMEADTVVWCDEERIAYDACRPLLVEGNAIAARMCFLERYKAAIDESRSKKVAVHWSVSCGYDASDRVIKLANAVRERRLLPKVAENWIPYERMNEFTALLPSHVRQNLLTGETKVRLPGLHGVLQQLTAQLPDDFKSMPKPEYVPLTTAQLQQRRKFLKKQAESLKKQ